MIEAQWCQRAGDKDGEGRALNKLGNAFMSLGQQHKAIEYHTKHLNISREFGIRPGEGCALSNMGSAFNSLGQHNKAMEFYTKSLDISRELGGQG